MRIKRTQPHMLTDEYVFVRGFRKGPTNKKRADLLKRFPQFANMTVSQLMQFNLGYAKKTSYSTEALAEAVYVNLTDKFVPYAQTFKVYPKSTKVFYARRKEILEKLENDKRVEIVRSGQLVFLRAPQNVSNQPPSI